MFLGKLFSCLCWRFNLDRLTLETMIIAPRAVTVVNGALSHFEHETGLAPRVILLPRRIFNRYVEERQVLDAVLPPVMIGRRDEREWCDVRIVEHEGLDEPEVY